MAGVMLFSDLSPAQLKFSDVKKNTFGGKTVYVSCPSGRVTIQTPMMKAPFGHNVFVDDSSGKESHSLTLNIPEDKTFETVMNAVDTHIKTVAVERSQAWFGRQQGAEVIDALYRHTIVPHPEGKYSPTFKVKIPWGKDGAIPEFYNTNREPVSVNDIENGSFVTCVIELSQIWFVNRSFGCTWKLMQCRVHPSSRMKGYCMIDSEPNNYSEFEEDE